MSDMRVVQPEEVQEIKFDRTDPVEETPGEEAIGAGQFSASQMEQASKWFEEQRSVNLDEVVIEDVPVRIFKYVEVTTHDEEWDEDITTTEKKFRTAHISTRVPMRVFNKMLKSHDEMMRSKDVEKKIEWMLDQVLLVWQLSEPKMTKEKLDIGLDFDQISGLFSRFFDKQLRLLRSNPSKG